MSNTPERRLGKSKEFLDAQHTVWQLSALSFILRGFCVHHLEIRLDNKQGPDAPAFGERSFNEEFNWVVWTLGDLFFSLSESVCGNLSELEDAGYILPAKPDAGGGVLS